MNSLISIIIPVYNCEKYIERCLNSIIAQTYKNIEILVINDGSQDSTNEIIKKINDSRIIYIEKNNTGVSDCRNIGISMSKGEYLIFVDADDYIDKNMIKNMYECIIKNKVDVLRCNYYVERGNKISKGKNLKFYNKILNKNDIINCVVPSILSHETKGYVWLLMIKKEKLKVKFNKNLGILEDLKFYLDLFLEVDSAMFMDENLYFYNCNNLNSVTKSYKSYLKNMNNMVIATYELLMSLKTHKIDNLNYLQCITSYNINAIINYIYLIYKSTENFEYGINVYNKLIISDEYKYILKYYNSKYSSFFEKSIKFLLDTKKYSILKLILSFRIKIVKLKRKENSI